MTTGTAYSEEHVKRLEGELQRLRRELRDAHKEAEEAEAEVETAEGRADEAEEEARQATKDAEHYFERYKSLAGSLQRHVWRDDKAGATYCVSCGDTWPIHRHDCPFGAVE